MQDTRRTSGLICALVLACVLVGNPLQVTLAFMRLKGSFYVPASEHILELENAPALGTMTINRIAVRILVDHVPFGLIRHTHRFTRGLSRLLSTLSKSQRALSLKMKKRLI
jgi:hypothetical protein